MLQDPAQILPVPPSHSELFASHPTRPSVCPVHTLPARRGTPQAVRCHGRNAGVGGPDCLGSNLGLPLSICVTLSSVLLSGKGDNRTTSAEALLGSDDPIFRTEPGRRTVAPTVSGVTTSCGPGLPPQRERTTWSPSRLSRPNGSVTWNQARHRLGICFVFREAECPVCPQQPTRCG